MTCVHVCNGLNEIRFVFSGGGTQVAKQETVSGTRALRSQSEDRTDRTADGVPPSRYRTVSNVLFNNALNTFYLQCSS